MRKLLGTLGVFLSALTFWLAWWPIRGWMFSQIPPEATWAGIAKIAVVILVAWGGGVALPLIILIGSVAIVLCE